MMSRNKRTKTQIIKPKGLKLMQKEEKETEIRWNIFRAALGLFFIFISISIFSSLRLFSGNEDTPENTPAAADASSSISSDVLYDLIVKQDEKNKNSSTLKNLVLAQEKKNASVNSIEVSGTAGSGASLPTEGVIDISRLSADGAYDKCREIIESPGKYRNKVIRVSGIYNLYKDGTTGKEYPNCSVSDSTGVCVAGLEFILKEGTEYPQEGNLIVIQGTFGVYSENGKKYYALTNTELLSEETPAKMAGFHTGN